MYDATDFVRPDRRRPAGLARLRRRRPVVATRCRSTPIRATGRAAVRDPPAASAPACASSTSPATTASTPSSSRSSATSRACPGPASHDELEVGFVVRRQLTSVTGARGAQPAGGPRPDEGAGPAAEAGPGRERHRPSRRAGPLVGRPGPAPPLRRGPRRAARAAAGRHGGAGLVHRTGRHRAGGGRWTTSTPTCSEETFPMWRLPARPDDCAAARTRSTWFGLVPTYSSDHSVGEKADAAEARRPGDLRDPLLRPAEAGPREGALPAADLVERGRVRAVPDRRPDRSRGHQQAADLDHPARPAPAGGPGRPADGPGRGRHHHATEVPARLQPVRPDRRGRSATAAASARSPSSCSSWSPSSSS